MSKNTIAGSPLIIFMLMPERGAFNASFALARRLQGQGYRILYGGPQRFQEHVQTQGFGYQLLEVPKPAFTTEVEGQPAPSGIRGWKRSRDLMRYYRRESRLLMDRAVVSFKQLDPVLVLFDPLIWPYAEVPLRCAIPMVSFSTTLASTFNTQVPPVFSGTPAGDAADWRVRWRNARAWARRISKTWFDIWVFEKIIPLFFALPPQSSSVRRIRSLGGVLHWGEYGPRVIAPELVVSPRELDYPQLLASNDRTYIGACVDVVRGDGDFDWQGVDAQKPLVYCSLGTYSASYPHARKLFSSVIGALKLRPDLQGIVQIGNAAVVDDFGVLPAHIRVVTQVPQIDILARASLFITHGGFSSVRESLYFGVPMLVFPCWLDQPGNAARVVAHGAGLQGDIATVDTQRILALLKRLDDSSFANAARGLQKIFVEQADCRAGLDFVNACIERQTGSAVLPATSVEVA